MREYIVTFKKGTPYEGKYAIIKATSLEWADVEAMKKWGHLNVSTVRTNTFYNMQLVKGYGMEEL